MDGNIAKTQNDIKQEAERFFSEFMNLQLTDYQGTTEEKQHDLLESRCTPGDCCMLEAEAKEEKIRKVLFSMSANKSPCPDGYPCEFFKTS